MNLNREQQAYMKVMAEKDAQTPSPEQRAAKTLGAIKFHLPNLSQWDLVCFCSEYLGMQAAALPAIEPIVKQLLSTIYTMHYLTESPEIKILDEKSATGPRTIPDAPSNSDAGIGTGFEDAVNVSRR